MDQLKLMVMVCMCLLGEFTVFLVTGAYRAVNWFMLRSLAGMRAGDEEEEEEVREVAAAVLARRVDGGRMEARGEAVEAREMREETGARDGEEAEVVLGGGGDDEDAGGRSMSSSSLSSLSSKSPIPSRPFSPCLWWTFSMWPFRCSF